MVLGYFINTSETFVSAFYSNNCLNNTTFTIHNVLL